MTIAHNARSASPKRPPFGKLLESRCSTQGQTWWILIGTEGWKKGKVWARNPARIFSLLPPHTEPMEFDWSIYRKAPDPIGLVRCGNVDGHQLMGLVSILINLGTPRVYDLLSDTIYRGEA